MLLHAALRNKSLHLRELVITTIGDFQLLERFLVHSNKLEKLWISTPGGFPGSILAATALALAAGLRNLDSLKEIHFIFDCENESLRLIIASLQGHPSLEKVYWRGNFDEGTLNWLFTLGASCPKLRDFWVAPAGLEEYICCLRHASLTRWKM